MGAIIWKIARGVVFAWGCLSLAGALVIGSLLGYDLLRSRHRKIDAASIGDVRYVLNWSGLGEQRIQKVLHSYVSPRSFTGDYLDAYAIQISQVDVAELSAAPSAHSGHHWYRGDQLPEFVGLAVSFAGGWRHQLPWFPSEAALRSPEFYVYPWTIHYHGDKPTAAELIFVRPADNMVFFIGSKT